MKWVSCGLLALFGGVAAQNDVLPLELLSPSGKMKLTFTISSTGRPTYSLALEDQIVVDESGMGLEFFLNEEDPEDAEFLASRSDSDPRPTESFYDGFTLIAPGGPEPPVERDDHYEVWYPIWGEESEIVDHHNELLVRLVQTASNRYMNIRFRMFDEGVGFRYEFPMQPNLVYYRVKEERTEFAMTGDHYAWWNPGDYDTQEYNYGASYLSEIRDVFDDYIEYIAAQTPFSKTGVQTSLQMKTAEGLYINIHEAALVNYSCMHLELDDETFIFESHLTPDVIGVKAHLQAPNTSPWRTIIASYDARDILRSRITYNLNEPMDPAVDWSWVKPVKYMGVWWEMITNHRSWHYTDDFPSVQLGITDYSQARPNGRHGATTEHVLANIDFAAEHKFDALLVEGWNVGWEDWASSLGKDYVFDFLTPYPDFDVDRVRDYAREKGVALMMHHETSSSTRNYERHLDRAYKFMQDNGYTSVKSGYVGNMLPFGMHHFCQDMVNHFHHATIEAARYHIVLNAHEAVRPTGLARTYPNMLAAESARGQEHGAFSGNHPRNVAIIPFTRALGGPMDYTPGVLHMDVRDWVDDVNSNSKVNSTIGYQLGLFLTMYSPLQMAADAMQNLAPHAGRALQFIEDVPIDWHKSVYIEAEPGAYITIARLDKNDDTAWYMGNVNGLLEPRDSTFELDFLDESTCYRAKIYHDSPTAHYWDNPHAYDISYRLFTRGDVFSQWTAAGGGYAVQFVRLGPLTTSCEDDYFPEPTVEPTPEPTPEPTVTVVDTLESTGEITMNPPTGFTITEPTPEPTPEPTITVVDTLESTGEITMNPPTGFTMNPPTDPTGEITMNPPTGFTMEPTMNLFTEP